MESESITEDKTGQEDACGIHGGCSREIPGWVVAIDNIPTVLMVVLGSVLIGRIWMPLAFLFLIYCGSSVVLFWRLICPCCPHFDTRACPCGYGVIAPKFFKPRDNKDFRKVFRRNIGIMFPCWLAPTAVGIYLLRTHYTISTLLVFAAFCLVGYIMIPAIAKFVGCKGCAIKDRCPWMSRQ